MAIWKVLPLAHDPSRPVKPRLIKADRITGVEKHLVKDFAIARAEPEELHELGQQGVKIEQPAE